MTQDKVLGILTGGGDCPGLNAVIRGTVIAAVKSGYHVVGFRRGFLGVLPNGLSMRLALDDVQDIHMAATSVLGTSHIDPYQITNGVSAVKETFERHRLHGLIIVGGRTTLGHAEALSREHGLPVIGVPKTITNDISGTDFCFGFFTAVSHATELIDRLMVSAQNSEKVMVVEVKGANSGFLAYYTGVAGGANLIVVPERRFTLEGIVDFVRERRDRGYVSSLVVISEGAWPLDLPDEERPRRNRHQEDQSMVAHIVADAISRKSGLQAESFVLGRFLRTGLPSGFDRVLGVRFGLRAVELCKAEEFGRMVALRSHDIIDLPLGEAIDRRVLDAGLIAQTELLAG